MGGGGTKASLAGFRVVPPPPCVAPHRGGRREGRITRGGGGAGHQCHPRRRRRQTTIPRGGGGGTTTIKGRLPPFCAAWPTLAFCVGVLKGSHREREIEREIERRRRRLRIDSGHALSRRIRGREHKNPPTLHDHALGVPSTRPLPARKKKEARLPCWRTHSLSLDLSVSHEIWPGRGKRQKRN